MTAANNLYFYFKAENVIMIELDMPMRTTRDYEGPAVAPKVQAALDAALQDEEDLTLDAELVLFRILNDRSSNVSLSQSLIYRDYFIESATLQNFGKRTSERSERESFPKFCNS